jgi:hypothetical protein
LNSLDALVKDSQEFDELRVLPDIRDAFFALPDGGPTAAGPIVFGTLSGMTAPSLKVLLEKFHSLPSPASSPSRTTSTSR